MNHKKCRCRRRPRGFTLVEMLAALVAAVVIIGAATGFMLTAALRQYVVLAANALEARHENLAEAMTESIKAATAFQIYASDPGIKFSSQIALPPGETRGNFLVCVRPGFIEEFALSGNQIIYTQLDEAGARSKSYDKVSTSAPLFDTNLGIIQAHWDVTTALDLIPFNVYGLPLSMQ
jgi:prepilin-type N-terminal cleavage/methylation domain-containing protein